MKYIELESDRLTFRKFRPDDFPVVFDWLSNLENMKYRSSELAWELHRDYWRKGYGTEIGEKLLRLGFETLALRRIVADCNTLNLGSYRIMEKIGMRREAHYVKYYRGNSALGHAWCDKYLYAILREEWMERRNSDVL